MGLSSTILKFKYKNFNKGSMPEFVCNETSVNQGSNKARGLRRPDSLFLILAAAGEIYTSGIYHVERIMTATAKLFMHGRSQAVRLPKEFRFEGSEVRVSKVGDKVILEPISKQPIDFDKFWAELDALGARDFLPDGIPDDPPLEPDPRVFFDE
jgi:antitoxin VapB